MTTIIETLEKLHHEQIAKANELFAGRDQRSAMIVFARAEGIEIALEKLRAAQPDDGYDEETCMCGYPIDSHTIGSGHTPLSMADYYRHMKTDTTPAKRSPKVRKI